MRVAFSVIEIAVAVLVSTAATSSDEANILFCRQEVSIALDTEAVLFESLYRFENTPAKPCSQSMFSGFQLDSRHMFPDTISVA